MNSGITPPDRNLTAGITPLVRNLSSGVGAGLAGVAGARPVSPGLARAAGAASTLAGAADLAELAHHTHLRMSETLARGTGSAAQVIGGLMLMGSPGNPEVRRCAATLAITGAVVKGTHQALADHPILDGALQGAEWATAGMVMASGAEKSLAKPAFLIPTAMSGFVLGGAWSIIYLRDHDKPVQPKPDPRWAPEPPAWQGAPSEFGHGSGVESIEPGAALKASGRQNWH